jgi:hypothetical protein
VNEEVLLIQQYQIVDVTKLNHTDCLYWHLLNNTFSKCESSYTCMGIPTEFKALDPDAFHTTVRPFLPESAAVKLKGLVSVYVPSAIWTVMSSLQPFDIAALTAVCATVRLKKGVLAAVPGF